MKSLITAGLLSLACLAALAQTTATSAVAPANEMAHAEVRKVDVAAKKVTLKHGPIKNLDMPGMTMVFQVKDATLLDKIKAGDKIRFSAEQQQGAYVVTGVEPVPAK